MKPLLIHNNNTYLLELFKERGFHTQKFDPNNYHDIDLQVDELIEQQISKGAFDAIFIKATITKNYLELLGLRLALHIRLSYRHPQIQNLPIIILCEESLQELCKIYEYPNLLFSEGLYLTSEESNRISTLLEALKENKLRNNGAIERILNQINVTPPANYQSHHSISNEWSIFRWAKVLGIGTENTMIQGAKVNIESLLYYKYLHCKFPSHSDPDKARYFIEGKGQILYIDDEWNKGWHCVLKNFFELSPGLRGNFETFEYDYRDKDEESIIRDAITKVESSNPSIVILDIRLSDDDSSLLKKARELTGCRLLEKIKAFNPGIRVIVFTASNKVWNLIELQNLGADGFILKESPELSVDKSYTNESIRKLARITEEQLKYQFQKQLYLDCREIKRRLRLQHVEENPDYNDFIKTLTRQIDLIQTSIGHINLTRSATMDIVFLSCFNFLELFREYYLTFNSKDYRYYLGYDEELLMSYVVSPGYAAVTRTGEFIAKDGWGAPSWFVTIAALFIDYFQVSASPYPEAINLKRIADKRNSYIHSDKNSFDISELRLIFDSLLHATSSIKE